MNESCLKDCLDCRLHVSENDLGFHYFKYNEGQVIQTPASKYHYIIFLIDGVIAVDSNVQESLICKGGQMVVLLKEYNYQITSMNDSAVVILKFLSAIQICNKLTIKDLDLYLDKVIYKFNPLDMKERMVEAIELVARYLIDGVSCIHFHHGKQMELFILFRYYYSLDDICRFFYKVIRKDISFYSLVRKHSNQAKNVEELAMICGYGLSNFKRLFKIHFQTSPYKWMQQQMIDRVHQRLLDKSISIKTIIAEFNFTDHSHLSIYCKRYLGATPSQIREGKN